jgi:hypothetical protein
MRALRNHLTYANVMSTIAMVLALGGATALAAGHLGKNSVTSKSIKNGAIKTADLKGGAVTNAKLGGDAVKGANIADGAVGIGDVAASLHLQCRGGTQYLQGGCIENNPHGTTDWGNAEFACQNAGARLPNVSELMTLAKRGVVFGAQEFTDVLTFDAHATGGQPTHYSETVLSGGNFIQFRDINTPTQYRCVFDTTG